MSVLEDRDNLTARLTSLTRDLILIRSTDERPEERRRCFQFIHNHLDELPEVAIRTYESRGYESLVATASGVNEPKVLMCGHLDVVEHPQLESFGSVIQNGRIVGPGAGDMKGAVAVMMEVFRNLHREHPGVPAGIAITSDEEKGGENGVKYLFEDVGLRCAQAIVPDGGSLTDVTVEEKGVIHARVSCEGHAAHAARPWAGTNAAERLITRLSRVKAHFDAFMPPGVGPDSDHWFVTCSLTVLHTPNQTVNCIPDKASAVLDIRFPPPHTVESIEREVAEFLGDDCAFEPLMTAEPTQLDPDPLYVDVIEEVAGESVRQVKSSGGSDARFIRRFGIPVNLSRPKVGCLHAPDEWIDIESMAVYYDICDSYIRRRLEL